jgi:oligopeptide/dipeptide ABC transporter ATP-binding protein
MPLLTVTGLKMYFPIKTGFMKPASFVHAVDGVSFSIEKGETFGLVGESGSGKTTCGRCVLRILEPTGGRIIFDGVDITGLSGRQLMKFRPKMQMVFQDPYSSLNPRKTIRQIVGDPYKLHSNLRESEIEKNVAKILEQVGLTAEFAYRYPHELSGGQKQRIAIARAIAMNPDLVFLDEPTSSLDVSVQAQILNLLNDLQKEFGMAYLFVTHNIRLIKFMADKLAVMYLGKIMESGLTRELFAEPTHPYTRALFSAVPVPDPDVRREKIGLKGEIPTPIDPPPGCRFYRRCWLAEKGLCDVEEPEMIDISGTGHLVACHIVTRSLMKR